MEGEKPTSERGERVPSVEKKRVKLISGTWKVEQRLGGGSYGDVFMITRGKGNVAALKVPLAKDDESVAWEGVVLRELHKGPQRRVGVIGLLEEGEGSVVPEDGGAAEKASFRFVSMEHLHPVAPTLAELLRLHRDKRLEVGKGTRVALQMLRGVYELHAMGVLHRDIKPDNVGVLAVPNDHSVVLLDLGMARAYVRADGRGMEPRSYPGACGTPSFESWRVLSGRDASRADDLFSWFYTVVETLRGELTLPWDITNAVEERTEDHLVLKSRLVSSDILLRGLPEEYYAIRLHLTTLGFEDCPDYAYLFRLLADVLDACPGVYPTESLLPDKLRAPDF